MLNAKLSATDFRASKTVHIFQNYICDGGERMSLKDLLDDSNLTMYGLAKKTGLGVATISEICNGKRKDVNLSTGIKIANALNISITQIQEYIRGEVNDEG